MSVREFELLVKLFCQAMNKLVLQPILERNGLTAVQASCLRYIYQHKEPSVNDVARSMGNSNAASTNLIERLVKSELVCRKENPDDRRLVKLSLTDKGHTLVAKIIEEENMEIANIMSLMKDGQVEALEGGIREFLTIMLKSKQDVEKICLYCGVLHEPECMGTVFEHDV